MSKSYWVIVLVIYGVFVPFNDSATVLGSGDETTIQPTTKELRGFWHNFEDYEYKVSKKRIHCVSYDECENNCREENGTLAMTKSGSVQKFIASLVRDCSNDCLPYGFWIALRGQNKTFKWRDGSTLNYTQGWEFNHPGDGNNLCVIMGHPTAFKSNLPWHSFPCGSKDTGRKGYVCQRLAGIFVPFKESATILGSGNATTTQPTTKELRGSWHKFEDYEYKVSKKRIHCVSYDECENNCRGENATLAMIKSGSVHKFIASLVRDCSNDCLPYGFLFGLRGQNKAFKWSDESTLNYTQGWEFNYPKDGNNLCVIMGHPTAFKSNLPWHSFPCGSKDTGRKGYVCQRLAGVFVPFLDSETVLGSGDAPTTQPTTKATIQPTTNVYVELRGSWHKFEDYEYMVTNKLIQCVSYDECENKCREENATLAMVKSGSVQKFIASLVRDCSDCVPYGFWIALRGQNKTFKWSDESTLNYTQWEFNYPRDGNNLCVTMGHPTAFKSKLPWHSFPCGSTDTGRKGYVCQRLAESNPESSTMVSYNTTLSTTLTPQVDISTVVRKTVTDTPKQESTVVDTNGPPVNHTNTTATIRHWSTSPQSQSVQTEIVVAVILPIVLILVGICVGYNLIRVKKEKQKFTKTEENIYQLDHTFGSFSVNKEESEEAVYNESNISQTRSSTTTSDAKSSDSNTEQAPDTTYTAMNACSMTQTKAPSTTTENAYQVMNIGNANTANKAKKPDDSNYVLMSVIPQQKASSQNSVATPAKPSTFAISETTDEIETPTASTNFKSPSEAPNTCNENYVENKKTNLKSSQRILPPTPSPVQKSFIPLSDTKQENDVYASISTEKSDSQKSDKPLSSESFTSNTKDDIDLYAEIMVTTLTSPDVKSPEVSEITKVSENGVYAEVQSQSVNQFEIEATYAGIGDTESIADTPNEREDNSSIEIQPVQKPLNPNVPHKQAPNGAMYAVMLEKKS